MAHSYSHLYEVPTTGLRFFTVYGPWGRPDMALFSSTKAILSGKPIELFNYGDMRRDYTYVDDIVQAVLLVGSARRRATRRGMGASRRYLPRRRGCTTSATDRRWRSAIS